MADPDDTFFLSPEEFSFGGGAVTNNTSHIRLGTGVTPIPMYFGTTITVDTGIPSDAFPTWGLDGLGWTREAAPAISNVSLDTRAFGAGASAAGGEVLIEPGRARWWADDGTPTFDSDDQLLYLTDVYTGSFTIPQVTGGSSPQQGSRLWPISGGPVKAGSSIAQGMVRLESDIWSRDWMFIGGTLATVNRVCRIWGASLSPPNWRVVGSQLQLLTPVIDGGELKIREDYKTAGATEGWYFNIPALTIDYVLAPGGFN